ncbi:MAG: zf-HC2 protein [Paenibacillaceae bacterium]|jgi:predicted anti-sigma-YlaC factor YlaD|nr:zf-HC2 protein [Paenibacillaceae bacterium]
MKCEEIQELFGIYFDLPEADERRMQVDEHILLCPACREEFQIWEESAELIRLSQEDTEPFLYAAPPVSNEVMNRIYRSEGWRTPVSDRIYYIPYKLRRNITAIIAFCLALFLISFVHTLMNGDKAMIGEAPDNYGIKQAAKASVNPANSLNVHSMTRTTLASAGPTIIDPVKIGPIRTVPDYLLSLSILGLISTLLIMNWLSRTRA